MSVVKSFFVINLHMQTGVWSLKTVCIIWNDFLFGLEFVYNGRFPLSCGLTVNFSLLDLLIWIYTKWRCKESYIQKARYLLIFDLDSKIKSYHFIDIVLISFNIECIKKQVSVVLFLAVAVFLGALRLFSHNYEKGFYRSVKTDMLLP